MKACIVRLRTEKPASLFVVHADMAEYQAVVQTDQTGLPATPERPTIRQDAWLGFAHEGLPAFGCFLGYNFFESWYASLAAGPAVVVSSRDVSASSCSFYYVYAGSPHPLPCEAEGLQAHSTFKWHPDATLRQLGLAHGSLTWLPGPARVAFTAHSLHRKALVKWAVAACGSVDGCRAAPCKQEESMEGQGFHA